MCVWGLQRAAKAEGENGVEFRHCGAAQTSYRNPSKTDCVMFPARQGVLLLLSEPPLLPHITMLHRLYWNFLFTH